MKVAVSWTGGKDSALAALEAQVNHDIVLFVNFRWDQPSLSHPFAIARMQSEATNKPFLWERVEKPYLESYKASVVYLKNKFGIEAIVTGDITVDAFHGKWIDEVCKDTRVEVIKPLWERDRTAIMEELLSSGLKVILTCVKEPFFTEDWLGRLIDSRCVQDLKALHEKNGVDICGEFGEYHTMVTDAPFFNKSIQMSKFKSHKTENGFIMEPIVLSLKHKPS